VSILVLIVSSPARIFASNRFNAVASRSRLGAERDGIAPMSSVGSRDQKILAANPPRTPKPKPSSYRTAQICTGSKLVELAAGREGGPSPEPPPVCSSLPPCVEHDPRPTCVVDLGSGSHQPRDCPRGSATEPCPQHTTATHHRWLVKPMTELASRGYHQTSHSSTLVDE
jgi:hypothetical protein